jgi:CBS domain-containing protein
MGRQVKEVMTNEPITLDRDASLVEAARVMRDRGIGDVIVVEGEDAEGIVTDRDIDPWSRRGCGSPHDTAGTGRERRPRVGRSR